MSVSIDGGALRGGTHGGAALKRWNHDGVTVWSAQVSASISATNTYYKNAGSWITDSEGTITGWSPSEDNYSEWSVASADIAVGEKFRVDSLALDNATPTSGTSTEVVLLVNGETVLDRVFAGGESVSLGPYPSASGAYTATTGTATVQIKLRGKVSAAQYDTQPVRTLTADYTVGV